MSGWLRLLDLKGLCGGCVGALGSRTVGQQRCHRFMPGLLLCRSKPNTKAQCVFMSNVLTCSGKVHVKRTDLDSTRFMAMAAKIMLFFPLKALKLCNYCQLLFICGYR